MPSTLSAVLLAASLAAPACLAQAPSRSKAAPPPCTTAPQAAPCSSAPDKAAPANDRFPFPGENPAAQPPNPSSAPADSPKSIAPAGSAPSPDAPAAPADKRFPFPGEAFPAPATPGPSTSSGASSSSSSDPTAFPSDDTDAPDPNAANDGKDKPAPQGRRLLKRVNPIGTKLQTNDEREAEDLNVARFYTQTGNLQGAYMRSQDAVKIMPDDASAHCALAQAALKLDKRDEAINEFNACLKLDPEEKEAKNARKELARLK